jgi:hypothetical protein
MTSWVRRCWDSGGLVMTIWMEKGILDWFVGG